MPTRYSYNDKGMQSGIASTGYKYETQSLGGSPEAEQYWTGRAMDTGNAAFDRAGLYGAAAAAKRPNMAPEDKRYSGLEAGMRQEQQNIADIYRNRALGTTPSEAAWQLQAGLNNQVYGARSGAASARGAAGLALAGQQAQGNIAAAQQNAFQQGRLLSAQERMQARGMYGQAAGAMRDADMARAEEYNRNQMTGANRNQQFGFEMGKVGLGANDLANQSMGQELGLTSAANRERYNASQREYDAYMSSLGINEDAARRQYDIDRATSDRNLATGIGVVSSGAEFGGGLYSKYTSQPGQSGYNSGGYGGGIDRNNPYGDNGGIDRNNPY